MNLFYFDLIKRLKIKPNLIRTLEVGSETRNEIITCNVKR